MTLENELNISKFRNSQHKTSINIIYTSNFVEEKMRMFFKEYDITSQQFNILRILKGAGSPLTIIQIRKRMIDKMSDTSRIVDRLLARGLITKTPDPEDRRLVGVALTNDGMALLEKIELAIDNLDKSVGGLSETEFEILNNLLDKVRHSL